MTEASFGPRTRVARARREGAPPGARPRRRGPSRASGSSGRGARAVQLDDGAVRVLVPAPGGLEQLARSGRPLVAKEPVRADLTSSTATGGSSHRSAMPSWNRANASTDWSGFGPAASTDARWTKLTPSSIRNVAYRSPARGRPVKLVVHGSDQLLVALHLVGLHPVAHHDTSHAMTPFRRDRLSVKRDPPEAPRSIARRRSGTASPIPGRCRWCRAGRR